MKRALVTGASQGIGLALSRELHKRGYDIIAVCRKATPELLKEKFEVIDKVDVRDDKSIQMLAKKIKEEKIDILVNNAGVFLDDEFGELDYDSINEQLLVNSLGPLKVTEALGKNLQRGSKVVMISSQMGSITLNSGWYYGYRMSKAALNVASISLAKDLGKKGVSILIIHPGYVKTRMTEFKGPTPPEESAKGIADRIEEHTIKESGEFKSYNGEKMPW